MNALSPILDASGRPYRHAAENFRALTSTFRGADPVSQELGGWHPSLSSPASEMWGERDPLVARIQDITRNNGFAAGAMQTQVDSVIGTNWRLSARPNWRALGIEFKASLEWATLVEAKWRSYADDIGCWIDVGRRQRFGGQLRTQFMAWFLTGEHLAVSRWLPDRVGPGRARYATTFQLIDPDRLSSPYGEVESPVLRQGLHIHPYTGEPLGYHIRDAHPNDWPNALQSWTWTYVPRETAWGRPMVLHGFEVDRDGQVRGKPKMASIVEALRLQDVYERAEAAGTILNAMYAATLETDFGTMDPDLARETFGADPETQKTAFPQVDMTLRGVRVPHLPPGTKLKFNAPTRPAAAQFSQFEATVLRRVAAGLGMSYEQVSRDYSQTNYSSARASLLEAWKFMQGRSEFMATSFADHAYALWLEEAINNGDVELPAGAPDFYEARADWVACRWIGPGRGWIDPNKEAQASQMKIDAGLSTLEDEAAEQGKDWQELLEQRAYEQAEKTRVGLQDTGKQLYRVNSTSRDEAPAQQQK